MEENRSRMMTEFGEEHWEALADYIRQGRVVPVIGPELLVGEGADGAKEPFYRVVAERLSCGHSATVNDWLSDYLRAGGTLKLAKSKFRNALTALGSVSQPLLRRLVDTQAFPLFLTTTPDSLLESTLRDAGQDADVYYFSSDSSERRDLPSRTLVGRRPTVYHVYGKASQSYDYAAFEDERLRYSFLWMGEDRRPRNLLSYLSDKYLLVLGCGYENWLTRFFMYGLKGDDLFNNVEDGSGVLADGHAAADIQLASFLSRCRGNIYYAGGVVEFVEDLVSRLEKMPRRPVQRPSDEFVRGDIFISYASENRASAFRVRDLLAGKGARVWLDKQKLESGEEFDRSIHENIEGSSLFLPLLSHVTAEILKPRYFRKEWRYAINEAEMRPPILPFIHPIAIEDVTPCANLPKALNDLHWIQAPGGELQEADLIRLVDLYARYCENNK